MCFRSGTRIYKIQSIAKCSEELQYTLIEKLTARIFLDLFVSPLLKGDERGVSVGVLPDLSPENFLNIYSQNIS